MNTAKIIILFALAIISISCCPNATKETLIRDTTYVKVPEIIYGEGTPQIINDTIIKYVEIKDTDTIVRIAYLPQKSKIEYMIKPDTVKFQVRDTLYKSNTVEKVIETPFLSKVGLVFLGMLVAGFIIYFADKEKKQ